MKKILVFLMTAALILSASAVLASADEPTLTFTYNFNDETALMTQYPNGGTCADSSKANGYDTYLGDTPYGLQLKTMKDDVARRTILGTLNGDNNGVIPAGKYVVSIWVRHNPASSSDWVTNYGDGNAYGEVVLSLYDSTAVNDDTLTLENGFNIKLLPQNDQDLAFEKTTEKTYSKNAEGENNKEWYLYTATITTTKEYSQFAFWCISNNDSKSLYAFVDDLQIKTYEEPQEDTTESEESGSTSDTDKAPGTTDKVPGTTDKTETTEPVTTNDKTASAAPGTEEVDTDAAGGCGSTVGMGVAGIAGISLVSLIVAFKKRKED